VHEQESQLGFEGLGVRIAGEIVALAPPLRSRLDHAIDELAHAVLAFGRTELSTEVLLRDDVRGQLGPVLGDFDVALLEGDLAALVGDHRVAMLPLDGVVGMAPGLRESTCNPKTLLDVG